MQSKKSKIQFSLLMSLYKNDNPIYLNNALQSVYDNTIQPNEYIIIKDGPVTQDINSILEVWENKIGESFKIFEISDNVGLAKALNYGLSKCSFEYVARMDSDDICFSERFERQISYLLDNMEISLLGTWYIQYDENMEYVVTDRKVPETHIEIVKYAKTRTPFNHVTAFFRKADIISSGGYPENVIGRLEDWWLSLKLIKKGYKLHNLPIYLVKVRGGEDFFRRRGGLEYLSWEYSNLISLWNNDLIDLTSLFKNVIIKTVVRLSPKFLREKIYLQIRKV